MRAQFQRDKMDQEVLLLPLKRELEQLRSQAFGGRQLEDSFRRMDAEKKELSEKLETMNKRYDHLVDEFTVN